MNTSNSNLASLRLSNLKVRNLGLMVFFAVTLVDFHAKAGADHQHTSPERPSVAADASEAELEIFSMNAFLRPIPLSVGDRNLCRAREIANRLVDAPQKPDIAVFTEAFSASAVGIMTQKLRSQYPYFTTRQPERRGIALTNGGLALYSRHPIEQWSTETFDSCAGWLEGHGDCSASKGVLHALVSVSESLKVNVLATHLDAGARPEDRQARKDQMAQIERFMGEIDELEKWPTVFVGDFNIEGIDHAPSPDSEYTKLLAALQDPLDTYRHKRLDWSTDRRQLTNAATMNCRGGGLTACRDITLDENWKASHRIDYAFAKQAGESSVELDRTETHHDAMKDEVCGYGFLSDHRALRTSLSLSQR